jgi:hypothetical protein
MTGCLPTSGSRTADKPDLEAVGKRIQEGGLIYKVLDEKYRDLYFTPTKTFEVTNHGSAIYTFWFVEGQRYHISHLSLHHMPSSGPINEETTGAGWVINMQMPPLMKDVAGVKMRTRDLDDYFANGTFSDLKPPRNQ